LRNRRISTGRRIISPAPAKETGGDSFDPLTGENPGILDLSLAVETGEPGTMMIKLGLHSGPCIMVTLNDRLDYFGRTADLAARLQSESRGCGIVLSQAVANDPAVWALLENLASLAEKRFGQRLLGTGRAATGLSG
jgi:hypothetical protein